MDSREFLARVNSIRPWIKGTQRAPHKMLMLLLMLGQLKQGNPGGMPYREVSPLFDELLRKFSNKYKKDGAQYPFFALQRESIWKLSETIPIQKNKKPNLLDLHNINPVGGFNSSVLQLLEQRPELIDVAAVVLLRNQYPDSYHQDILKAVGLSSVHPEADEIDSLLISISDLYKVIREQNARDPKFRREVLDAYSRQCAICGYDISIAGNSSVEAAHILWHAYKGPNEVHNGIALCPTHHNVFDRGGITIQKNFRLRVSVQASSNSESKHLEQYQNKALVCLPTYRQDYPKEDYLKWHREEVFLGN